MGFGGEIISHEISILDKSHSSTSSSLRDPRTCSGVFSVDLSIFLTGVLVFLMLGELIR